MLTLLAASLIALVASSLIQPVAFSLKNTITKIHITLKRGLGTYNTYNTRIL